MTISLRQGAVAESDEVAPGIIVERDAGGKIVGLELLDASKRADNPKALELAVP